MATYILSSADKDAICRAYSGGASTVALARQYERTHQAVNEMLRRHGVVLRTRTEAAPRTCRYRHETTYFDAITTEPQAYWLGFLAADGYVHAPRCVVALVLHNRDRAHLERFRDALASDQPFVSVASTQSTRLAIVSPKLVAGLKANGVGQAKSLTIEWPTHLGSLTRHYLRGYFDGDGHAKATPTRYPTPALKIGIASNRGFLLGCQRYLMDTLGFGPTRLTAGPNNARHFYLEYGGRRQVRSFYHLIYDGASVWLPRKREKLAPWM